MQNTDNSNPLPLVRHRSALRRLPRYRVGPTRTRCARLFQKLILESFQAGLSWITILRKRDHFRAAFRDFDPDVIAPGASQRSPPSAEPRHCPPPRQDRGHDPRRAGLPADRSARGLFAFLWSFVGGRRSEPGPPVFPTSPRRRRNRKPCPGRSRPKGSASLARRSPMPSCRPPAWSTTTSPPAMTGPLPLGLFRRSGHIRPNIFPTRGPNAGSGRKAASRHRT
jgi:hypothetical protein